MLNYRSVHWLLLYLEFSMSFRSFWSVCDPTQSRRYLLCVCVSVQINWLNGSVGDSGPGVAILEYQPPKRGIVHAEDIMRCVCRCCAVCVCVNVAIVESGHRTLGPVCQVTIQCQGKDGNGPAAGTPQTQQS